MMDIVDQETSGWLNEGSLIEECRDEADRIWLAGTTNQFDSGIKAALRVLRRRHLVNDQGVEILRREGA